MPRHSRHFNALGYLGCSHTQCEQTMRMPVVEYEYGYEFDSDADAQLDIYDPDYAQSLS